MFTVKNAVKNIYRYKGKYTLFGILYFLTICVVAVATNIHASMNQITDNLIKEYCGVVRIRGIDSISKDEYMSYRNNAYVDDVKIFGYNFCTRGVYARDFQNQFFDEENIQLHTADGVKTLGFLFYNPVLVFGYDLSLRHLLDIEFNIAEGRMYENDDECIIGKNSKRISENWNYLDIGDEITFEIPDMFRKKFTVVGILEEDPYNDINTNARFIYTTYEGAECFRPVQGDRHTGEYTIGAEYGPKKNVGIGYDALIYLKDHNDFDNFHDEMWSQSNFTRYIDPLFYNFHPIKNLLSSMQAWSAIFMLITCLIIVLVTVISTVILQNSRKYEMAVLRSVGATKGRMIVSYLIENLVFIWAIAVVALTVAQFVAPVFTGGVYEGIRELVSAESFEKLAQGADFGLMLQNIGIVFAGATGVVALSLILACVNIIRFEPLKIFNRQY